MEPTIRAMRLEEAGMIVDYFHQSTPEHLDTLGVDPTRLPPRTQWLEYYAHEFRKPVEDRGTFMILWELGKAPIGFSVVDKIVYGEEAYVHLHITSRECRGIGLGVSCLRESVRIYFDTLKLQRLYSEPNAFNSAPNRTLQAAGFKYVKTYKTVPGRLNYRQAVNRWMQRFGHFGIADDRSDAIAPGASRESGLHANR